MSKSESSAKVEGNNVESNQLPRRTVGISIMCLLIVFVAAWMTLQSQRQEVVGLSAAAEPDTYSGFRSDAWYLPDDPLWGFVKIPSGPFMMGSNPALDRLAYENERWSSTRRQGSVDIDDFYIGKFEVTVAQFRLFAQQHPALANEVSVDIPGNIPITNITWPEALAYARWLEVKIRNSPATHEELRSYFASGGQLSIPSEAEWEKAARGSDGRIFPWGNTPSTEFANYAASSILPVGSKPCTECAYGLQDMSGNAWELTRSPLQAYPYSLDDDNEDLAEDALWVMRGGAFSDSLGNVRASVRGGVDPGVRNNTIGFRLAISKP
ncbi:MAG: sulfatase activating formylglycine-generating enzyme [Pseudohongiellaceae bacterium]|jgi:formylglycine-generating enzyme required for sulfatase activity